jgi:hypothetical protein
MIKASGRKAFPQPTVGDYSGGKDSETGGNDSMDMSDSQIVRITPAKKAKNDNKIS